MATDSLLYRREYEIAEGITVVIPTVGQILADEDGYNEAVAAFTSMPIDFMVPLDDIGIDFSTINEWDLFSMLFGQMKEMDFSLVLKGIQFKDFERCVNKQTQQKVFYNQFTNTEIGKREHALIASTLRKINHMEKDRRKPANEDAKKYMLERARAKMKRKKNRKESSQLEQLIVALVNTEQFKYNFDSVRDLTIYQFNECVRQIIHKVNWDNRMHGVYSGTVNAKELSQDELNWLIHK